MPYGIDKDKGGDSPSNVKFVENCVKSVMKKNPGMDKSKAIAICKSQLKKSKSAVEAYESLFFLLDEL